MVFAARDIILSTEGRYVVSTKSYLTNGLHSAVSNRPRNLILAQLPETEYAVLQPHLVAVSLPLNMSLSEPELPIQYIIF